MVAVGTVLWMYTLAVVGMSPSKSSPFIKRIFSLLMMCLKVSLTGESEALMSLVVAKRRSLASYPPRVVAVFEVLWSVLTLNGWSVTLVTSCMYG